MQFDYVGYFKSFSYTLDKHLADMGSLSCQGDIDDGNGIVRFLLGVGIMAF